jgi:pimeloyl-ACP methyl ester carboxylesterase
MVSVVRRLLHCRQSQAEFYLLAVSHRPPLLLLPGALTAATSVLASAEVFAEQFQVGVLAVTVPGVADVGFSRSDALDLIEQAAQQLRAGAASTARLLILGESVGGVLALEAAIGMSGAATLRVLCIDPPLAPARLWPVRRQLAHALRLSSSAQRRFIAELAQELFGYRVADLTGEDGGSIIAQDFSHEPVYHHLLATCPAPVLILTGDEPLWPVRPTQRVPCCLDQADRYFIEHCLRGHVQLEVFEQVGHLVLRVRPRQVLASALRWLEATG